MAKRSRRGLRGLSLSSPAVKYGILAALGYMGFKAFSGGGTTTVDNGMATGSDAAFTTPGAGLPTSKPILTYKPVTSLAEGAFRKDRRALGGVSAVSSRMR